MPLNFFKNYLTPLLFIIGTTAIFYHNLYGTGIPSTHDGSMHVVRMINYYLAFRQGQLPPRIGPQLANGFGYPVFNYNYPLANIIALPLFALHLPYDQIYQLTTLLFLIFGALGWWYLINTYTIAVKSKITGLAFYLANPYTTQLVFVRGGIGEIAATSMFPWLLLGIKKSIESRKTINYAILGVLGGLFILAHNVMVLIAAPIVGIYALYVSRLNWRRLVWFILSIGIALGLSAFFWLPALGEKDLTVLNEAPINLEYKTHFVYPLQFLSSAWGYFYSRPGPVDGMSFQFSLAEIFGVACALMWGLSKFKSKKTFWSLSILTAVTVWLAVDQSKTVWGSVPVLNFIQFPWRLLWISHFLVITVILYWLTKSSASLKTVVLITTASILSSIPLAMPLSRDIRSQETWIHSSETTSTMNENLPKGFNLHRAYNLADNEFKDRYVVATPAAEITTTYWTGSKHLYQITTNQRVTLTERTAYFPGWETKANGRKIISDANDPWNAGLLTYTLNPGTYTIETKFTQHTPHRMIGNNITLFTLISLGLYAIMYMYTTGRTNQTKRKA